MATAAEQMARNMNFGTFAKAKDLQARILFTLFILVLYRLGTYIPVPGVDPSQFEQLFQRQSGGMLGSLNMFAGGAVERMSVFALNVMPYITASIIVQMMTSAIPSLEKLKKESFNLRFQKAGGQLENTARVRFVRRTIARILTVLNSKVEKV